ncbi:MAG TPA: DUF1360 domain-containing protein [Anaerolineales bacterium]|nr:DUF1360 domain-containing protein [Anaerolineales bacterium]
MSLTIFFYLALAAWRLASLVANENGPWQMFKRLRQRAEQWCRQYQFCHELGLYELFSCEWCNSIWIGTGLTLLYIWIGDSILYVAIPLALSTVVIVIKYAVEFLQAAKDFLENANKAREQSQSELFFPSPSMDELSALFPEKR